MTEKIKDPTPTSGIKWPTNSEVCWLKLPPLSPYEKVWKEAATRWNNVTNFEIQALTHYSCPTSAMRCFTAHITTVENSTWAGITYLSYFPESKTLHIVSCHLNKFYTDAYELEKQLSVATHEFGHAMGLSHHPNDTSVMKQQPRTATTPQQDDIDAINRLYSTLISDNELNIQENIKKIYISLPQWAKGYNNTNELYQDADVVIEGTVSIKRDPTSEEEGAYYTYCTPYEITVNNFFKGEELTEAAKITVDLLGGQVNEITIEMEDVLELPLNKKVLLFLKKGVKSYYLINEGISVFIEEDRQQFRHAFTDKIFTLEEIQSGITFA